MAKGHVIGTNPAWGTLVPANSVVKVFLSVGQRQVSVPGVVGEDVNTAQNKLTNAGLTPVVKTDTTSTAAANTVVKQSPAAGTSVAPNASVTIYVSAGGTTVKNVVGLQVSSAQSLLQNQGFKVSIQQLPGPDNTAPNTVWQQQPNAGTTLAQGSTVTIFVQPATPSPPPTTASPSPTATDTTKTPSPPGH